MSVKAALNKWASQFNVISKFRLEIGVFTGKSHRKVQVGITNAELMFIHENGSPLKHIPARPVLQYTIQDTIKTLLPATLKRIEDGCFNHNWTKADVKLELEKMCVRMQSIARRIVFRSDRLAKNSPATIKAKGSAQPLVDTGQLGRSITCQLVMSSKSGIEINDSG